MEDNLEQSDSTTVDLTVLIDWFQESEDQTSGSRLLMDRDVDYYDGKQLSAEEIAALKKRKQPPIVNNLIKPSIDYLAGVEKQQRVDPIARGRTPDSEPAAYAATQALRFVIDNVNYDYIRSHVWKSLLKPGMGGCKVSAIEKRGQMEVEIEYFEYDRFFFDAHSSRGDFEDARYMGIVVWMDENMGVARFGPEFQEIFDGAMQTRDTTVNYDDKPDIWINRQRRRVRVIEIYYLNDGVWHEAIYTKGGSIVNHVSPYLDEDGQPHNPIIAQSAYVDRENNRYGQIREMIDMQDDVNKRRSKATHLLNSRQVIAEKGAVDNPAATKKALAQPDALIEVNRGYQFDINGNAGLEVGQFQLMQNAEQALAKNDLKTAMVGTNSQSGVAKQSQQQAAFVEVGDLLDNLRHFDVRVFRAVWARIKQVWDAPRWIRVTDDPNNVQFMGLNVPQQDQFGNVVAVENPVAEMDVDFTIEDAPDVVSLAAEEFQTFANLLPTLIQSPPQWAKIALSLAPNFRSKQEALKMIEGMIEQQQQPPQPDPMQQEAMKLEFADKAAKIDETQSKTALNAAKARAEIPERVPVPVPVPVPVAANQGY